MADVGFDIKFADPGATPELLKATETVVQLLHGFTQKHCLSILMNACAILFCHLAKSETDAVEMTKGFRRETERCIRRNFSKFKENEEKMR